jgi:hypothetical protein
MEPSNASGPATDSVNEPRVGDHASDRLHNTQNITKLQARPRDRRRPKGEPNGETAIYAGRQLAGAIAWRGGICTALDADEQVIGVFANSRAAMRAITAARR